MKMVSQSLSVVVIVLHWLVVKCAQVLVGATEVMVLSVVKVTVLAG